MTNVLIAGELYVIPRTVNAHVGSLCHNLGSNARAGAARFAIGHDIL